MKCKYCNEEILEDSKFCRHCGQQIDQEEVALEADTAEAPVEQTQNADALPDEVVEQPPKKKKVWPLVVSIIAAILALSTLAIVLLFALGVDFKPKANDIFKKEVYTVSDEAASKKADVIVAVANGKMLTNTQLQIYYRMQVVEFLNYYGEYVSDLGLDYTKPLAEQTCYYDDTKTWEQYFLEIALTTWHNYATLNSLAEQDGFQLEEDWQQSLDDLPDGLKAQAEEDGYETVDAMLSDVIGPGCTLDAYLAYVKMAYISNNYYGNQYQKLVPTDEEATAYFQERSEVFAEDDITLESGLISSVRHILVCPQGGNTDETTGITTYSEEEWVACLKKAEGIVEEWKAGGATEESFVALVGTYSEDGGSATTGGLYESIFQGSGMVEPFESWAIDPSRKPGDVGIVKADEQHYKGYHIMYFVEGEQYWLHAARSALLDERTTQKIDTAKEQWPMMVKYKNIYLVDLGLA